MKQRVLAAIEFQWLNFVPFTKLPVEGRGRLYPFPFQVKLHESMVNEDITPQKIDELFGCQMILHGGEAHSRRDGAGPPQSTEQ